MSSFYYLFYILIYGIIFISATYADVSLSYLVTNLDMLSFL